MHLVYCRLKSEIYVVVPKELWRNHCLEFQTIWEISECSSNLRGSKRVEISLKVGMTVSIEEGAEQCRQAEKIVKKSLRKAKEDWIADQCDVIEGNIQTDNTKNPKQLVKDLTSSKQGQPSIILEKNGKYLTENKEIMLRLANYCSDMF